MLRHLDLCSGIGGFALAAAWGGVETIQFVEIDKFCQKILKQYWPNTPCHDDLKTFNGNKYNGTVDLLTAGYPCQPFSVAGKQKAEEDPRHLWPEVLRVIRECRPRWIICENVEGHIRLGYDTVHSDLEKEGYTVWPFIIPASGIGARHRRNRLWIVAHASGQLPQARDINTGWEERPDIDRRGADDANAEYNGSSTSTEQGINGEDVSRSSERSDSTEQSSRVGASRDVANTTSAGLSKRRQSGRKESATQEREGLELESERCSESISDTDQQRTQISLEGQHSGKQMSGSPSEEWQAIGETWSVEPSVGRVAHGIPNRVDGIKGLGNAVVPQIPFLIIHTIKQYDQLTYGDIYG